MIGGASIATTCPVRLLSRPGSDDHFPKRVNGPERNASVEPSPISLNNQVGPNWFIYSACFFLGIPRGRPTVMFPSLRPFLLVAIFFGLSQSQYVLNTHNGPSSSFSSASSSSSSSPSSSASVVPPVNASASAFFAPDGSVGFALNVPEDANSTELYFTIQGESKYAWTVGLGFWRGS